MQPLLLKDANELERQCADQDAEIKKSKRDLALQEEQYEHQRHTLNSQYSQVSSDLAQVEVDLNDIELRHETFIQADMQGLEHAVNQLPEWRAERDELATHLQLLREAEGGSRQRFESRKLELSEQLNEFVEKVSHQQQKIRNDEQELRAQQAQQQRLLEQEHQQQRQLLHDEFQNKHTAIIEQQADVKARLAVSLLSAAEQQDLDAEQARVDDVQLQLSNQSDAVERLREAYERCKTQQDQHLEEIKAQRKALRNAEQRYQQLKLQQAPTPGSLRHFLQQQVPGWQHNVGKVIREDLLERTDLAPSMTAAVVSNDTAVATLEQQLFNIRLDLAAINLPSYAQDDQALAASIEQALSQVRSIEQQLSALEDIQKTLNANAELQSDLLHKARQTRERYNNDLRFAREARQRLLERYQQLQQQRKQALQEQQQQLAKQLEALKNQQKHALHLRDSVFM